MDAFVGLPPSLSLPHEGGGDACDKLGATPLPLQGEGRGWGSGEKPHFRQTRHNPTPPRPRKRASIGNSDTVLSAPHPHPAVRADLSLKGEVKARRIAQPQSPLRWIPLRKREVIGAIAASERMFGQALLDSRLRGNDEHAVDSLKIRSFQRHPHAGGGPLWPWRQPNSFAVSPKNRISLVAEESIGQRARVRGYSSRPDLRWPRSHPTPPRPRKRASIGNGSTVRSRRTGSDDSEEPRATYRIETGNGPPFSRGRCRNSTSGFPLPVGQRARVRGNS